MEKSLNKFTISRRTFLGTTATAAAGLTIVPGHVVDGGLFAEDINIKLLGNERIGYFVDVYYNAKKISTSDLSGEFTILIENGDRSVKQVVHNWKATSARVKEDSITLKGKIPIKGLETDVLISVAYRIVTNNVVEKSIELYQTNIPLLYYTLKCNITPEEQPLQYWSFDDADNKGGTAHETYPAAGYYTKDGIGVGLLSDSGYKNLWTRNIRRRREDGRGGFKAICEICDANLVRLATSQERKAGRNYVQFTFGEMSDFSKPKKITELVLPQYKKWKKFEGAILETNKNLYKIKGVAQHSGMDGFKLPFNITDGYYTVKFKYRSTHPIALRIFKGDGNTSSDVQGFYYQNGIKSSQTEWTNIEESVFIANTETGTTHLFIGNSDLKQNDTYWIEIKDLQFLQYVADKTPYHRLMQGRKETKKLYLFGSAMNPTLHNFRLASQVYFADGAGFKGTDAEKCLWADAKMLMWITSSDNFNILSVPNINYAPDMYNRDSFWSAAGLHDKQVSESIFNSWAYTQTEEGGIGTIITPYMGSKEVKDNEATLEFLWFALINNKEFGTHVPMDKIKKAFKYILNVLDPDGDAICNAKFVLGQNDVLVYPKGTSNISLNQGMFAVTLKVAKMLDLQVKDSYIEKAYEEYRKFYNPHKGYLIDNRDFPYAISFAALLPEFVSLWLFDEPILSDEMVINTLDKIPYDKNVGYSPFISHLNDVYFTQQNQPFDSNHLWPNGIYYNAGSWLREEVCGYVTGIKHGWKQGKERIIKRLKAEITLNPDEPFSHEYLPYDLSQPDCWKISTRVFSWNVFALKAMEIVGLRASEQDPDYKKNK